MQQQEPMTKTIKASVARQQFSQLLNEVFRRETRVLAEKSGIPVAAMGIVYFTRVNLAI